MCVCVCVLQVDAFLLSTQQEQLQEKRSNSGVSPRSLAGCAADDDGDCPHLTYDLIIARPPCLDLTHSRALCVLKPHHYCRLEAAGDLSRAQTGNV